MSVQKGRQRSLKESDVFHILGNDRRRAIVQLLEEHTDRLEVSDVAKEIAASESDTTPVPNNLYKSVYVSLQQTHLPQLEEDEVIEYESDAKTIEPGRNFEDVIQYVNGHGSNHAQVLTAHLVLGVIGLAVIALSGVELAVLSILDPLLIGVLCFLGIAGSSLYFLLQ